jgi:hypothetical protein
MDVVHEPDLPSPQTQNAVSFIMRFLVLAAAVIFLYDGAWESALGSVVVLVLMLVPQLVRRRYRMRLPLALDFGIVFFIFTTLFLGHLLRFYELVPWWDKFLHFQSGLILSVTGFVLVYILNENEKTRLNLSPLFVAVFAVTFSVTIGVVWEIVEFMGDGLSAAGYWQGMSGNNADTMWDLIADLGGSLIVSIAGWAWMHRYKKIPFAPKLMERIRKIAGKGKEA